MLGLTVACARCHDHKFDPIPTADYYSLHGVFVSTVEPDEKPLVGRPPASADYQDYLKKVAEIEQKNRDIYFTYVQNKSAEFREKADVYLLTSLFYRKNQADQIQKRNKLIQEHKLDRDLYQNLRVVRPDSAVFFPLVRFNQVQEEQFASLSEEVLPGIV